VKETNPSDNIDWIRIAKISDPFNTFSGVGLFLVGVFPVIRISIENWNQSNHHYSAGLYQRYWKITNSFVEICCCFIKVALDFWLLGLNHFSGMDLGRHFRRVKVRFCIFCETAFLEFFWKYLTTLQTLQLLGNHHLCYVNEFALILCLYTSTYLMYFLWFLSSTLLLHVCCSCAFFAW